MKTKLFKSLSICIILCVFSTITYTVTSNNNSSLIHNAKYKPAGDPPW